MDSQPLPTLPSYSSPTLHLTHPTPSERLKIWTTTALSWDNTAPELLPLCLQRLEYQTTIPLAKSGGMTMWILTDSRSAPEHRPLLASCETFRKRAFFTRKDGDGVADRTVHGIASVFTPPLYRRQGFAGRLMRELKAALVGWQATVTSSSLLPSTPCIGSILYSDIGPTYYAKLGWEASGSNKEYIFQIPQQAPDLQHDVRPITRAQLAELCSCDERLIRKAMGAFAHACRGGSGAVVIIPDLDHMLWHMAKDEFTAEMYLGGIPLVKGAVVGCPGERVWVAWTHSYCRHPLAEGVGAENGLYILRLVVEEESTATVEKLDRLVQSVRGVLQAAQCEALQWRLGYLSLWEPSEVIRGLIERCGIEFEVSQRADAGIASGMWYGEDGDVLSEPPLWVYNERYAYC